MTARSMVCLAALLLLVVPTGAADGGLALEFDAPSQVGPGVAAEGLTWALLVFSDASDASFALALDAPTTYTNHSVARTGMDVAVQGIHYYQGLGSRTTDLEEPLEADVAFPAGAWRSLYVEAASLTLDTADADGLLDAMDSGDPVGLHAPSSGAPTYMYRGDRATGDGVSVSAQPRPGGPDVLFHLRAEGVRVLEWHEAHVACTRSPNPCPDGGGATALDIPDSMQSGGSMEVAYFSELAATDGALVGGGTARVVAAGGPVLDVAVAGEARLPMAASVDCTDDCLVRDQTLSTEGNVTLSGLSRAPGSSDRLRAEVGGDGASARLDEKVVDAAVLLGLGATAAGAAGIGLLWIGKVLFSALFTRRRDAAAVLEQPLRRRLYETIHADPGIAYRELLRRLGVANGTVRHHLNVLLREGLVVEHPHLNTVRLFPHDSAQEAERDARVLLRDGRSRRLFDWIDAHAGAIQAEVAAHAEAEWGWRPNTTQYRLKRLVEGGLVEEHREGRVKRYGVRRRIAARPRRGFLLPRVATRA